MATTSADIADRGGRPHKRDLVVRAARTVFAREGYVRTSIDAIATEAGVSTRTIYNHFAGKEQLFSVVVQASATQVADGFVEAAGRHPAGADVRGELLILGYAFAAQRTDFPEHFAMVGHIRTEAQHFPPAIIDAWREAGPLRVQREVADRLQRLADRGRLHVRDVARAAAHFSALVTAGVPVAPYGSQKLTKQQTGAAVTAGVDAFLHGYATDPRPPVA